MRTAALAVQSCGLAETQLGTLILDPALLRAVADEGPGSGPAAPQKPLLLLRLLTRLGMQHLSAHDVMQLHVLPAFTRAASLLASPDSAAAKASSQQLMQLLAFPLAARLLSPPAAGAPTSHATRLSAMISASQQLPSSFSTAAQPQDALLAQLQQAALLVTSQGPVPASSLRPSAAHSAGTASPSGTAAPQVLLPPGLGGMDLSQVSPGLAARLLLALLFSM
jgi:hypothetical protein